MVEKQTLGDKKNDSCLQCSVSFLKKRYDQKFCCRQCCVRYRNRKHWLDLSCDQRKIMNENRKKRYLKNRETILEAARKWRRDNPLKARQIDKIRYRKNKESLLSRSKIYRANNPEVRTKEYDNLRRRFPWKKLIYSARHRALKRGLSFDLTHEWAKANWTGKCSVSGLEFDFGIKGHYPLSPSIDRINPAIGYLQDNCRFVCFAVNSLKGCGTDRDVLNIASAIIKISSLPRVSADIINPSPGDRLGTDQIPSQHTHPLLADLSERDETVEPGEIKGRIF